MQHCPLMIIMPPVGDGQKADSLGRAQPSTSGEGELARTKRRSAATIV